MSLLTIGKPGSEETAMKVDGRDWVAELLDRPVQEPALITGCAVISFGELARRVDQLADELKRADVRVVATLMDNSADWVALDLALMKAGATHVPVAGYYSSSQQQHVLHAAGVDTVIGSAPLPGWASVSLSSFVDAATPMVLNQRPVAPPTGSSHAKISFTSGSTGNPKGVCLDAGAMASVARSVARSLMPLQIKRHLTALPYAVLLENIAGLYGAMKAGAATVVLPAEKVGLLGSSSFDAQVLETAVASNEAQSVIVLPQMLRVWAAGRARKPVNHAPQECLKFVAVGGAKVGRDTIDFARKVGLPAYEGYGLSEAGSVQTLNLPGSDRPGSAGRVLPHARIRCSSKGEIEVGGSLFSGYLDAAPRGLDDWWATGDLGRIDADGFLWIHGRSTNVLITGYGRNVSPEWVETVLQQSPAIAQAVVYGDGEPALCAVLWASPGADEASISQAVRKANEILPDYARIGHWVSAEITFDAGSGAATANGRPRREKILKHHQPAIDAGYRSSK